MSHADKKLRVSKDISTNQNYLVKLNERLSSNLETNSSILEDIDFLLEIYYAKLYLDIRSSSDEVFEKVRGVSESFDKVIESLPRDKLDIVKKRADHTKFLNISVGKEKKSYLETDESAIFFGYKLASLTVPMILLFMISYFLRYNYDKVMFGTETIDYICRVVIGVYLLYAFGRVFKFLLDSLYFSYASSIRILSKFMSDPVSKVLENTRSVKYVDSFVYFDNTEIVKSRSKSVLAWLSVLSGVFKQDGRLSSKYSSIADAVKEINESISDLDTESSEYLLSLSKVEFLRDKLLEIQN